jgi:hypothetical protein
MQLVTQHTTTSCHGGTHVKAWSPSMTDGNPASWFPNRFKLNNLFSPLKANGIDDMLLKAS